MAVRADADRRRARRAAAEALAYRRAAGWSEERIERRSREGLGPLRRRWSARCRSAIVRIRTATRSAHRRPRTWRVVVGSGHSPEHACLVDDGGQTDDRRRPGAAAHHLQRLAEPQRARRRSARRMARLDREAAAASRRPAGPALAWRAVHRPPRPARRARRAAITTGSTRCTPSSPSRAARSIASPSCSAARSRTIARPRHRRGAGPSPPSRSRGTRGPRGAATASTGIRAGGLTAVPPRGPKHRQCDSHEDVAALSLRRRAEAARGDRPRLESGEASLDESIELYGEGDRLQAAMRGAAARRRRRGSSRSSSAATAAPPAPPLRRRLSARRGRARRSGRRSTDRSEIDGCSTPCSPIPPIRARGSTRRCAMPRSAAASGCGRCWSSPPATCSRSIATRALRVGARDRVHPRLFADPRRSAVHGR